MQRNPVSISLAEDLQRLSALRPPDDQIDPGYAGGNPEATNAYRTALGTVVQKYAQQGVSFEQLMSAGGELGVQPPAEPAGLQATPPPGGPSLPQGESVGAAAPPDPAVDPLILEAQQAFGMEPAQPEPQVLLQPEGDPLILEAQQAFGMEPAPAQSEPAQPEVDPMILEAQQAFGLVPEQPAEPGLGSEFLGGLESGAQTVVGMANAFGETASNILGWEDGEEWFGEQYQRWMQDVDEGRAQASNPDVASIDNMADFANWLSFNVGSGGAQMAGAIASFLAGGVPAMALYAYGMGTGEARSAMEGESLKLDDRVEMPTVFGLHPFGKTISVGELTAATGVPMAAIEFLGGPEKFMRGLFGNAKEEVARGAIRRILGEATKSGVTEMAEEMAQGFVSGGAAQFGAGEPLDAEWAKETAFQNVEQALAVGPAAFLFGGGAGAIARPSVSRETPQEAPTEAPQPSEFAPAGEQEVGEGIKATQSQWPTEPGQDLFYGETPGSIESAEPEITVTPVAVEPENIPTEPVPAPEPTPIKEGVDVWHGGREFEGPFSTEYIGTGEGATMRGWGLYFAEKRGVSEWYRRNEEKKKRGDEVPSQLYRVRLSANKDDYLSLDDPIDYQSEKVRAALQGLGISSVPTGERAYQDLAKELGSERAASLAFRDVGIAGSRYWDAGSRNRPFKEIKNSFLAELPEDSDIDEVESLIGTGHFSPPNDAVLAALRGDDWLGFDYPSQAISAAYSRGAADRYDMSPGLVKAVADSRMGGSYNYVIFDESVIDVMEKKRQAQERSTLPGPVLDAFTGQRPGAEQPAHPTAVSRMNDLLSYGQDRRDDVLEMAETALSQLPEIPEPPPIGATAEPAEPTTPSYPVYNRAQWLTREAEAAQARGDTAAVRQHLSELRAMAQDSGTWTQASRDFEVDDQGNPVPYESRRFGKDPIRVQYSIPGTHHFTPGSQYQGRVQAGTGGVIRPKGPLRREDIISKMAKGLGTAIYQGRIKRSSKFGGFYRKGIEEVRTKNPGDIEVAAHEIAHLLDDRFKEISQQWRPSTKANETVRDELRSLSYDRKKLYEGFAEYVRHWMTNPHYARKTAPEFTKWFEKWVDQGKHKDTLRTAQAEMQEWFDQVGYERLASKIAKPGAGKAPTLPTDHMVSIRRALRYATMDDKDMIEHMERDLRGEIMPNGTTEKVRTLAGAIGLVEGAVYIGAPVIKKDARGEYHDFEGDSLSTILGRVWGDIDNFLKYAVAESANELKQQRRENLFTQAEIDSGLSLKTPAFERAFNEYQEWNNKVVDFAEAKGAIDPDFRASWNRNKYLPFFRVGGGGGGVRSHGVPGDWRGIRALTGGTDNLRDILGNMIGNASMLIQAGLVNEARASVFDLARMPGGGQYMVRIPSTDRRVGVLKSSVQDSMLREYRRETFEKVDPRAPASVVAAQTKVDAFEDSLNDIFDQLQNIHLLSGVVPNQPPSGGMVVAHLVRGKPVYAEVASPLLYRSLISLQRPARSPLRKVLSVPKNITQGSITSTPDFMIPNMTRDTLLGGIMSRFGFVPGAGSIKGMYHRIAQNPVYRLWLANGGAISGFYLDEESVRARLNNFHVTRGIDPHSVVMGAKDLWHMWRRIQDSFEASTRLGEMDAGLMAGKNPRHVAYGTREVSTDFARRPGGSPPNLPFQERPWYDHLGNAMNIAYDSIIFLKAAANGMDRVYRGFTSDPHRGRIAALSAALAMASAGLWLYNMYILTLFGAEDEWDDMENWQKDTYWHMWVPTPSAIIALFRGEELPPKEDRLMHFKLPRIWEIGAGARMAELMFEETIRQDRPISEFGGDAYKVLEGLFQFEYAPAFGAPFYELWINRHRFTGRQIETIGMQGRDPHLRYRQSTPKVLVDLADLTRDSSVEFSPAQADHVLRGFLNTWYMYGVQLTDAVFYDNAPDLPISRYPVIRRFFSPSINPYTKHQTTYYELLKEATIARRNASFLEDRKDWERLREEKASVEYRSWDRLSPYNEAIKDINTDMKNISTATELSYLERRAKFVERKSIQSRRLVDRMRENNDFRTIGAAKAGLLEALSLYKSTLFKRAVARTESFYESYEEQGR